MKKSRLVEELAKHPFMKQLRDDYYPIIDEKFPESLKCAKNEDLRSKVRSKMEDSKWYRYEVFQKLSGLFSVLDRIVHAHSFLQVFPMPRTYEKRCEITQDIWINYHFLYYIFSVVSLFDCILILTNAVFRIGLRDRDCKRNAIIKNYWVRRIEFDLTLKKFEPISDKYKGIRNMQLHRGKGKNVADIAKSDTLALLNRASFLQLHGDKIFPQNIIDLRYKGEVNDIIKLIDTEVKEINDLINKIFSNLHIQYIKQRKPLKNDL